MTERQDGILWRFARLHPGWVTLIVWLGYFAFGLSMDVFLGMPAASALAFTAFMFLFLGYPLFVLLFLPGRFRTWSPRRPGRALAAFFAIATLIVAGILVGSDRLDAVVDAANSGDLAAEIAFTAAFFVLVISFLYLIVEAALVLVAAERGKASRTWPKIAAVLQFFYLPLCVYFLHKRIRRLVSDFESGDPIVVNLPLEALKVEPLPAGHLFLLLTERIGWDDFEGYATELLRRLDGRVARKGSGADMHIWNVVIETLPFRLVYDDFPNGVTLESESHAGDMLLKKLQARLAPDSRTQAEAVVSGPAI